MPSSMCLCRVGGLLGCLLASLWGAVPALATEPVSMAPRDTTLTPATQIHYDPATRQVTLLVPPLDRAGRIPTPLHPEDLVVYENGVPQSHVTVKVEHTPITVGVLLEYGGRYPSLDQTAADAVSMAAQQFISDIGTRDRVAIWTYGNHLRQLADFSQSHLALQGTIIDLQPPPSSELNFYDALDETLAKLHELRGHAALLVVSSGRDTFSRMTFRQLLQDARSSGTPIYVIDLGVDLQRYIEDAAAPNPYASLNLPRDEARLKQLALASGGQYYAPEDMLDLSGLYDELMARLRVRYRISYHSSAPASDTASRSVRVELLRTAQMQPRRQPRMQLIATAAYLPARREPVGQLSTGVSSREAHSVQEPSYKAPEGSRATSSARLRTAALSPEPQVVTTWLRSSMPHAANSARSSSGDRNVCCAVSTCV